MVLFAEHITQLWPLLMLAIVTAAAYFATAQPKKRPQLVDADASESGKKVFSNADSISSLPPSYGSISAASACPPPPAYERFPRFEPIHSHPPVSVIDFSAGRNLLNKKEVPPSTIKESSESSQTIDEQDGDKAGKTLNHENTVVRVDTSAKAQAQAHAQLQQKAQGGSNTNSPRPAALPGSQTLGVPSGSAPSEVVHFMASWHDTVGEGEKEIVQKQSDYATNTSTLMGLWISEKLKLGIGVSRSISTANSGEP
ncbi:unnamed protein product, partial [Toxocara canis]|uniref:Secreted protein n=1 Tax=Toxocara canis TaxID=6265 RepID=A0A183V688_TOXCA